jgi:hypothetical protein
MGFLDKLLGREKKPRQETAPAASVSEPVAHDHSHDEGEPHSHEEGGAQGEQSPPA